MIKQATGAVDSRERIQHDQDTVPERLHYNTPNISHNRLKGISNNQISLGSKVAVV